MKNRSKVFQRTDSFLQIAEDARMLAAATETTPLQAWLNSLECEFEAERIEALRVRALTAELAGRVRPAYSLN